MELRSELMNEEFVMMEGMQMNQQIHRKPYGIVAQIQAIKNTQIPTEVQNILKQYP